MDGSLSKKLNTALGLTQTDAVLGVQTKWSEMYFYKYIERDFVQCDNEMRRLRMSCNYWFWASTAISPAKPSALSATL